MLLETGANDGAVRRVLSLFNKAKEMELGFRRCLFTISPHYYNSVHKMSYRITSGLENKMSQC